MELNISGIYTYVPKWRGNNKLPKEKQIVITYRYMTCEEEELFTQYIPRYDSKNVDKVELDIKTNANAIWDTCVQKVTGITDASTGKEITDPKKVREIKGIYKLITEVVGEIKKGLDEEELKNSE
jgi:hypothetical protein